MISEETPTTIDNVYICPRCGTEGYDQECDACDGSGEVELFGGEWEPCEDCDGTGTYWGVAECPKCGHTWEIE